MEPLKFTAGDTVRWVRSIGNFRAGEGWVLTYAIRGPKDINITAVAQGDAFAVELSAATTASYKSGQYWWQAYVTRDGERHHIGEGTLIINEDLSQMTGATSRLSHVRKTLAALEAMIEKKATRDQQSYSIAGRSLSRMSVQELLTWRDTYKRELVKEERAAKIARGENIKNTIHVRFGGVR